MASEKSAALLLVSSAGSRNVGQLGLIFRVRDRRALSAGAGVPALSCPLVTGENAPQDTQSIGRPVVHSNPTANGAPAQQGAHAGSGEIGSRVVWHPKRIVRWLSVSVVFAGKTKVVVVLGPVQSTIECAAGICCPAAASLSSMKSACRGAVPVAVHLADLIWLSSASAAGARASEAKIASAIDQSVLPPLMPGESIGTFFVPGASAPEDLRERQGPVAEDPGDLVPDRAVGTVPRYRLEEIADPLAAEAEADDAGGHVDQVGAPDQLDLGAAIPLGAEFVMPLDRVEAEPDSLLVPAAGRSSSAVNSAPSRT